MSFTHYKEYIEEGDTVILFITPYKMFTFEVKHKILNKNNELVDNVFHSLYGSLKVPSLIGTKYGTKISLTNGGWAYVLHPTCELWTTLLTHRTQILYTPDISMVLFQLELKPGSVVIEAGTGSGSMTHSLARTVYPNGKVYSFEFHFERQEIARNEFGRHYLSDIVHVSLRNVCQDGFGDEMKGKADAVFLDLPSPWDAVRHVIPCIKKIGGRLASFSPCIEQVQKFCGVLHLLGCVEIITMEVLQKELTVVEKSVSSLSFKWHERPEQKTTPICMPAGDQTPGHTGYLTFATLPPYELRSASVVIQQPVKIAESNIENIIIDENYPTESASMASVSDLTSDL